MVAGKWEISCCTYSGVISDLTTTQPKENACRASGLSPPILRRHSSPTPGPRGVDSRIYTIEKRPPGKKKFSRPCCPALPFCGAPKKINSQVPGDLVLFSGYFPPFLRLCFPTFRHNFKNFRKFREPSPTTTGRHTPTAPTGDRPTTARPSQGDTVRRCTYFFTFCAPKSRTIQRLQVVIRLSRNWVSPRYSD